MGNVFNRYGAGGGKSEGLYIWKKSAYTSELSITNPSITITTYAGTVAWCYVKGDNFDATLLPEIPQLSGNIDKYSTDEKVKAVALFFEGFVSGNYSFGNDSAGLYLKSGSTYYRFNAGQINGESYVLRCVSSITILSGTTFTYSGTKTIPAKIGDMVGYVVSDKEDEYPDKEVKDGYYYEKIALSLETFGCTKFETGSFTMTSDEWLKSVTHSMGVKPLYAIAWTTATTGATRIINSFPTSGEGNAIFTWNNNANHVNYSGQTSDTTGATISTRSNTYYAMKAGSTYRYILMA